MQITAERDFQGRKYALLQISIFLIYEMFVETLESVSAGTQIAFHSSQFCYCCEILAKWNFLAVVIIDGELIFCEVIFGDFQGCIWWVFNNDT